VALLYIVTALFLMVVSDGLVCVPVCRYSSERWDSESNQSTLGGQPQDKCSTV